MSQMMWKLVRDGKACDLLTHFLIAFVLVLLI